MHLALTLDPMRDVELQYAQQLGADWVMAEPSHWESEALAAACHRVRQAGMVLAGLECLPQAMYGGAITGSPERDAEIERVCALLGVLGQLRVPVVGYRWFAALPALPPVTLSDRGSAVSPVYRTEPVEDGAAREGRRSAWETLAYFLPPVLRAAEQAGVRLAHQVGLPSSPWWAAADTGADELDRLFAIGPSRAHGLDLDHGLFAQLPGVDAPGLIRRYCRQARICAVRVRAMRPVADGMADGYLDEQRTDLIRQLAAYREGGFEGPVRAGTPRLGEDTPQGHTGQAFSIGYLRGLLAAIA